MPLVAGFQADWLDTTHPIYNEFLDRWTENERRLRGGDYVLDELRRFKWESLPGQPLANDAVGLIAGEHYLARQREATYINFPEMFTLAMKGHLYRNRPMPGAGLNFGTLGDVRRDRNNAQPTNAELLYYNTDGVGNDGSQWDNFWLDAWTRACATGHRWMFVEAPIVPPQNQQDILDGKRPYMVEWAPQQVINWNFEAGRLAWAFIRVPDRRPTVSANQLSGNDAEDGYLLVVRRGNGDLGSDFATGGWWRFDADKKYMGITGSWDLTRGEIPMWPLYYERDSGVAGKKAKQGNDPLANLVQRTRTGRAAMSRAAMTELGQAAVAYMNLSSAADYDAWDAASSLIFLLGIDKDAFNVAAAIYGSGSQVVPVPASANGQVPQIGDGSSGAVTAQVFDLLLQRKFKEAEKIAVQEATSVPQSTGESKRVGFGEVKAPRLANIASEIEQAQNVAIHFLELRWGVQANLQPSGSVVWPREFDIADIAEDVRAHFEISEIAKLSSPTLDARLMVKLAKENGHITDDADEKKIEGEYLDAADRRIQSESLAADFSGDGGGSDGGGDPGANPGGNGGDPAAPPARRRIEIERDPNGRTRALNLT